MPAFFNGENMPNINIVMVQGYLGRAPDIRYTPDGAPVCNLSLATSRRWTDSRTGEQREETEWHRIVAYNRQAEIIGEHAQKGTQMFVEGRLRTRKWQASDGSDRYTTEIVMSNFQFGRKGNVADSADAEPPQAVENKPDISPDGIDDDIPF